MLCTQCTNIFSKKELVQKRSIFGRSLREVHADATFSIHHDTLASFEEAIGIKCGFCLRLLQAFKQSRKSYGNDGKIKDDMDPSTFTLKYRLSQELAEQKGLCWWSSLHLKRKDGKAHKSNVQQLLFFADEQKPLDIVSRFPPTTDCHPEVIETITSWIRSCLKHHESCQRVDIAETTFKFSRIIDVGEGPTSELLRICPAEDVPSGSPYMTLSHCWGGIQICVLSSENEADFAQRLPMHVLPQTFKDAICLTRHLGIRYLWIDSLCIRQDSMADWRRHAQLMDVIYQGSHCNIAATKAQNSLEGLFAAREPHLAAPLRVAIGGNEDGDPPAYYDVGDDLSERWNREVAISPLCARAWVIQERLLAPRVVHFGQSQLYWECREVRTCEASSRANVNQEGLVHEHVNFKTSDPHSRSAGEFALEVRRPTPGYVAAAIRVLHDENHEQPSVDELRDNIDTFDKLCLQSFGKTTWNPTSLLWKLWTGILGTYSIARLTSWNDRLIAAAGVAKVLAQKSGTRYVAGHWMDQLPRQLLWTSQSTSVKDAAALPYVAPSWSWASAPLGVLWNMRLNSLFEDRGVMDLISVIDVKVKGMQDEDDPVGQVKSGILTIRGRLLPIELDTSKWQDPVTRADALVKYWNASSPDPPRNRIFLVPVIFTGNSDRLPATDTVNGILVEATDTRGRYKRIGVAGLSHLCPLECILPSLYDAKVKNFEHLELESGAQETHRAPAVAEGPNGEWFRHRPSACTLPSAKYRQELARLRLGSTARMLSTPQSAQLMDRVRDFTSRGSNPAVARAFSGLRQAQQRLFPMQDPRKDRIDFTEEAKRAIVESTKAEFEKTHGQGGIVVKFGDDPPPPTPRLDPKDVVEPSYYLDYIEDERSVTYGNFVFEIV